jgi:hypothetical protein
MDKNKKKDLTPKADRFQQNGEALDHNGMFEVLPKTGYTVTMAWEVYW